MSIFRSFLCQSLNVTAPSLADEVNRQITDSPFHCSIKPLIPSFLNAHRDISDELWKFSVALNIPHALVYESFNLQHKVEQLTTSHQKVG